MKAVVAINSGSSSIKFSLFTLDGRDGLTLSAGGKIEKIGIAASVPNVPGPNRARPDPKPNAIRCAGCDSRNRTVGRRGGRW